MQTARGLTEGEQNQLIQKHVPMVAKIAAEYRGRKGIPFADLEAAGMLGLVKAARAWEERASFPTYAVHKIRSAIADFVRSWQQFERLDENDSANEERIFEWKVWGILPTEGWHSLTASPAEIRETYEDFAETQAIVDAALVSLNDRERKMIRAHFLRAPAVQLEQIARDHKLSYYRTVEIVYGAVNKMAEVAKNIKNNQSDVRRTGRPRGQRARDLSSALNVIPFKPRAAH